MRELKLVQKRAAKLPVKSNRKANGDWSLFLLEYSAPLKKWTAVIECEVPQQALRMFQTHFKKAGLKVPRLDDIEVTALRRPCFVVAANTLDGDEIMRTLYRAVEQRVNEKIDHIQTALIQAISK